MRKCAVSSVHHSRYGSLAALTGDAAQSHAQANNKANDVRARVAKRGTDNGLCPTARSSQIVVKQRLAIAHVPVNQLSRLGADLGELGAEARLRSRFPGVTRL